MFILCNRCVHIHVQINTSSSLKLTCCFQGRVLEPHHREMRHRPGFIGVTDQVEGRHSADRGELTWPRQTERRLCLCRESSRWGYHSGAHSGVQYANEGKKKNPASSWLAGRALPWLVNAGRLLPQFTGALWSLVLQYMGPRWGQILARHLSALREAV